MAATGTWPEYGALSWSGTFLDPLGRPQLLTRPDGSSDQLSYRGRAETSVTRQVATGPQQEGRTVTRRVDPLGRLRVLSEQVGPTEWYEARYEYDLQDRLSTVSLCDSDGCPGQTRTFTYSPAGFLVSEQHPELGLVTHSGYTALGGVMETVAGGVTTSFAYDPLGRLEATSVGGQEATRLVYGDRRAEAPAQLGEPDYGRVVSSTQHNRFPGRSPADVAVSHEWQYLGQGGRVSSRTTRVSGVGLTDGGFTVGYGYDPWGNVAHLALPYWRSEGCTVRDWDHLEALWDGPWLEAVALVGDDAKHGARPVADLAYHPSGRVGRTILGLSLAEVAEAADPHGMARPASIGLTRLRDGEPLWSTGGYAYDGSGNISAVGLEGYTYDGLDRLTGWSHWGQLRQSYAYDRFGNLIKCQSLMTTWGLTPRRMKTPTAVPAPTLAFSNQGRRSGRRCFLEPGTSVTPVPATARGCRCSAG